MKKCDSGQMRCGPKFTTDTGKQFPKRRGRRANILTGGRSLAGKGGAPEGQLDNRWAVPLSSVKKLPRSL